MLNQYADMPRRLMPRPWRAVTLLAGYLVAIFSSLPCAYAASNTVIWERGDQIVRLAKQDDASAPPNDHPVSTTAGEIEAMLEILRLRYADDESDDAPVSVFTKEEIDNLGNAIATGLDRATPSQDVIFHVIGARRLSRGAFGKRNRVSAGRIFYRDGKFNIIFGQIQTPHRKKNVYGQVDQDFYPRNYGSRTAAAKHDVVFLTNSATRLYQSSAGVRADWIIVEPGAAVGGNLPDNTPDPVPTPTRASSVAPAVLAEAPEVPSPPEASSHDTARGQPEGMSAQAIPPTADVEERLKAIKRLRERELISEDAYQTKMKEILQDL